MRGWEQHAWHARLGELRNVLEPRRLMHAYGKMRFDVEICHLSLRPARRLGFQHSGFTFLAFRIPKPEGEGEAWSTAARGALRPWRSGNLPGVCRHGGGCAAVRGCGGGPRYRSSGRRLA